MANQFRIIVMAVVLAMSLASCAGGAFGGFPQSPMDITETNVVRTIRYFDEGTLGPQYEVSFTVPESWVGSFETSQSGSVMAFDLIAENGRRSRIFQIDALSRQQFWEQNGSYPTQYSNILNTWDTYFIYYVPIEAFYSGLSQAEYDAITAEIPNIIDSFIAEEMQDGAVRTMLLPAPNSRIVS